MRKSSLVKAMACFMAATMAVTFVPSANVTNGVSVVAQAAEVSDYSLVNKIITETNDNEVTLVPSGWWTARSNSYRFTGNFSANFKFTLGEGPVNNIWEAPNIVFTNDKDAEKTAGTAESGYAEYIVIRPDNYGWGSAYSTISFNDNFGTDDLTKIWPNATIDMTVTRVDDEVTVFSKIKGGNGKSYTRTATFSYAMDKTIRIFFSPDGTNKETLESFADLSDYINYTKDETTGNDVLPEGVEVEDGVYVITPSVATWAAISATDSTKYEVYLNNLFKTEDSAPVTVAAQEENTVTIKENGVKQTLTYKIAPVTHCKTLEVTNANDNIISSKEVPFTVEVSLTPEGGDNTKVVTDKVEASYEGPEITLKRKKTKNTYTYTITPTADAIPGTGTITFKCGNAKDTIHYTVYGNKCVSITSTKGDTYADGKVSFYSTAKQATTFTVTATGESETAKPSEDLVLKSVTGASILTTKAAIGLKANQVGMDVTVYVAEGTNELYFQCANQTLLVNITGSNGTTSDTTTSTGTTTPSTTPTDTTTPADTTTPSDTTGSAVDTTPSDTTNTDTTTPSDTTNTDTTTPSDTTNTDTTTPSDTTNTDTTTPSDTSSTTTKKKIKVTSVTAKKGKKVVSGKVTKKATVKVTVNKKTVTTKSDKNGKFSVKVAKKLAKGTKVKIVVTKSGYKKVSKTITVK